jgi:hypothetical protein
MLKQAVRMELLGFKGLIYKSYSLSTELHVGDAESHI